MAPPCADARRINLQHPLKIRINIYATGSGSLVLACVRMRAHSELSLGSESGSVAAAPKACLACGACCFSELTAYVRVSGEDYSRLGERAAELVLFDGYQAYMQMLDGHCAALVIDLNTEERVCSAYDTRPQICRTLERSSAECWAERTEKAERPLILLQRLLEMSDGSLRVKREGSP